MLTAVQVVESEILSSPDPLPSATLKFFLKAGRTMGQGWVCVMLCCAAQCHAMPHRPSTAQPATVVPDHNEDFSMCIYGRLGTLLKSNPSDSYCATFCCCGVGAGTQERHTRVWFPDSLCSSHMRRHARSQSSSKVAGVASTKVCVASAQHVFVISRVAFPAQRLCGCYLVRLSQCM